MSEFQILNIESLALLEIGFPYPPGGCALFLPPTPGLAGRQGVPSVPERFPQRPAGSQGPWLALTLSSLAPVPFRKFV